MTSGDSTPTDSCSPHFDSSLIDNTTGNSSMISSEDHLLTPVAVVTASAPVPSIFPRRANFTAPVGCPYGLNDAPIPTNNFYTHLAGGDQTSTIWTLPYSLWLSRDSNFPFGLCTNHTTAAQRVYGPNPSLAQANYFFNPIKIKLWVISAESAGHDWQLNLANPTNLSVDVVLRGPGTASADAGNVAGYAKSVTFPLVQGMAFVTAIYRDLVPLLQLQVGIRKCTPLGDVKLSVAKYSVVLNDNVQWMVYAINGTLSVRSSSQLVGNNANMVIQVARVPPSPDATTISVLDSAAGLYADSIAFAASVDGKKGTYALRYHFRSAVNGATPNGLVFALPHHQQTASDRLKAVATQIYLDSPTKGIMRAYKTSALECVEPDMPTAIGFDPWTQLSPRPHRWLDSARDLVREAAEKDVQQNVEALSLLDNVYFSGKALDKFAHVAYVCHFYLRDVNLTRQVLAPLKRAIGVFARNRQQNPLVYDELWKGLISSAKPDADFGNSNYNDHHFHYGYMIHAIALVGRIDPAWIDEDDGVVRSFATTLVRDVASPVADKYFPAFRCFDWFHGHSWAHGILPVADGKDEESLLEDAHFAMAMKLWAMVVGDRAMRTRADLMLAVLRRSVNNYMLLHDNNTIYLPKTIVNKVLGILFENKMDYATWFGRGAVGDEYIHGIHMLPITGISLYIRPPQFVAQEWLQKCSKWIDRMKDGWRGILTLNMALFDPFSAWSWFARSDWDDALIDQGMSRTWLLAFIASVGGAL